MSKRKSVTVSRHKRTTPSNPAWKKSGNKPGPKSVSVEKHRRTKPNK